MTVSQLIEQLKGMPGEAVVAMQCSCLGDFVEILECCEATVYVRDGNSHYAFEESNDERPETSIGPTPWVILD